MQIELVVVFHEQQLFPEQLMFLHDVGPEMTVSTPAVG
jgi:hypothetical protein